MNRDEFYIRRCFELASQGLGNTAPNPLVGCVIVKGDTIIAEGSHEYYGGPHAEVNAIKSLPDDYDFSDCTVYVNLEPCSHFGKTPPCSDLVISKKVKRVVICNVDTNPLVAGKGIEKLRKSGIEVESGVLETEGKELNKRFFTFHEKKRPYIILKWAQTADGFISRSPLPQNKEDNWITSAQSKALVHTWRAQEQAILVGANTVLADDPMLTTRLANGKNPERIVIDRDLSLPLTKHVFDANAQVFVITEKKHSGTGHIHYLTISFDRDFIHQLMRVLFDSGIQSVIVEGGAKILNQFIQSACWDEARIFVGEKEFGSGIAAPAFDFSNKMYEKSGTDLLYLISYNS